MKKLYTLLCALFLGASMTMFAKPVTNTTTSTDYDDLASAISAVNANDELKLNEDVTVAASITTPTDKAFTINGNGKKIISNVAADKVLIYVKNVVTFNNVTFDGNSIESSQYLLEASGSGIVVKLNDVTFTNAKTTHERGLVCAKGSGKFSINNVTFDTTCSIPEGRGFLFNGTKDSEILGNNTCSIFVEQRIKVMGELTNTTPIKVTVNNPTVGTLYIMGDSTNDFAKNAANFIDKFTCGNTGYKFVKSSKAGHAYELILAEDESTGISEVAADGEGVVNVYNMQGVVVRANVSSANAAEGLAPGLYIMGGKKVLVR